jgi:hypothetical protein
MNETTGMNMRPGMEGSETYYSPSWGNHSNVPKIPLASRKSFCFPYVTPPTGTRKRRRDDDEDAEQGEPAHKKRQNTVSSFFFTRNSCRQAMPIPPHRP